MVALDVGFVTMYKVDPELCSADAGLCKAVCGRHSAVFERAAFKMYVVFPHLCVMSSWFSGEKVAALELQPIHVLDHVLFSACFKVLCSIEGAPCTLSLLDNN